MSPTYAASLGYLVAGVLALVALIALLGLLIWVAGLVGAKLFRDLRRVYCLSVITYWLKRLEREGYHTFQRARCEVREHARNPLPGDHHGT